MEMESRKLVATDVQKVARGGAVTVGSRLRQR